MDPIFEYIKYIHTIDEINRQPGTSVRRNNRLADRIRSIAAKIESVYPERKPEFHQLLFHEDASVRIWCAHHMLEVMHFDDACRKEALAEIVRAAAENDGAHSYGNFMWLKQWHEQHPEDRALFELPPPPLSIETPHLKIICAANKWTETVCDITHRTIRGIYPLYYSAAEVDFFLKHHACDRIRQDVENGDVYLCFDQVFRAVGTVTVKEDSIRRLFVLPEHQGKGYGSALLQFAEKKIFSSYEQAVLDTSLPGKPVYLKRGYTVSESGSVQMEGGEELCYEIMIKYRHQNETGAGDADET